MGLRFGLAEIALPLVLLLAVPVSPDAQIIYVDQDASGPIHDGSSWCNAITELHEALSAAPPGATIRIADGLHLPDASGLPDPRDATFTVPANLTIVGAYAGCGAPDPDARDPFAYITVLSGDLGGDDLSGGLEDNVRHVVTAPAGTGSLTSLNGLVIVGGNAVDDLGGGILALGGRLILSVCKLERNRAWRGGAIYSEAGELRLFQCRFTNNATSGEGGAIFDAMSSLEAHNCLFALNSAGNDGGAIFFDLCSTDFFSCSFGGNESAGRGGAIYDYVGVETYAGNCVFWGNTDMTGSGQSSQIFINPSNTLAIDYSCVQGLTGGSGGEGNIGDDPLFAGLAAGDLHLLPDSPCIDAGSNALVGSQLDLDGNPRIVDGTVDMGCYEYQITTGVPGAWPADEPAQILSVATLPGESTVRVRVLPPRHEAWSLAVYSVSGRRLVLLDRGIGASGQRAITWDGRDVAGRPVSTGVYFFALSGNERLLNSSKAVYIR